MSHELDSFCAAVSALAGHGHVKERLVKAFEHHLRDIDGDTLPIPMRQTFADLSHQMHRVAPLNGEGPIWASVRKMSVDEADHCAQMMVDLFGLAVRHCDDSQALLPLDGDEQSQVPPFLVKSG